MKEWYETYLIYLKESKGVSQNTFKAYAADLRRFIVYLEEEGVKDFHKISDTRIQAYERYLRNHGKSNATISRSLVSINKFLSYLIRKRVIEEDPMESIHLPKVEKQQPTVISYEQMEALLHEPDLSTLHGKRDRAILEILYATGIKASELIQLQVSDVNLRFGCITVRSQGHERVIPLGKVALEVLSDYLAQLPQNALEEGEYLFNTRLGQAFTRQGIWKLVKQYARKLGMGEKISLQTIRNSFAAHMIDNGADLKSMQELLGVSDVLAAQRFSKSSNMETFSTYLRTHPRNL